MRGVYLGSVRTMYRFLAACDQVRERRNQLTYPVYTKPQLLAVQANKIWSWDITKLRGPGKWTCFHFVRDSGYLQPLRGPLDDRPARER